ncbi:MAG TPA: A/G-specific adenine glycosylase [Candidatus Sulfotelmatobacter sp.]|nr:A/G-specific adenine glycosylase [Candidatus Sulfotelmatobacter sp.]
MNSERCSERSRESIFRQKLLTWYDVHARDLPWRKNRDPYRVWVSEIMLQQTRVAAVIEHYHEFLRRFPNVKKLAKATLPSVLAAWSGLGYYRRARMMHAAARVIARDLGGKFPETAADWQALPGIGRYTSAAIASIAFGEPVPVVDGNVERVVQRFAGERLTAEKVWQSAGALLDCGRPGDFNQAMMELGATVCTPRTPSCLTCPIVDLCNTRGELPLLAEAAKQRKRVIHYWLDCRDGAVFLTRRPGNARLMADMWELPEASAADTRTAAFTLRHSITITNYTVRVRRATVPAATQGQWISLKKLPCLPLTGLARKILRKAEMLPSRAEPALSLRRIRPQTNASVPA